MPPAARVKDMTTHGPQLMPGIGSLTVQIGFMPAWRALPAGVGAGLESASDKMDQFMKKPVLTPADATPELVQVQADMTQAAGQAAGKGNAMAAGVTAGAFGALAAANGALTATWTAASAVPGGQPAANTAYTQGIKTLAAVAASAAMAAVASMADMHVCTIPCPIPPHGPGVVTQGSKSVFIDNLPAARQDDKVIEACGGSDPIAMGCQTVLIGDDGGGSGGGGGGGGKGAAQSAAQQQKKALQQETQQAEALLGQAASIGIALLQNDQLTQVAEDPMHTFNIKVVDDETGNPVRGVALKIKLPDGQEATHTTDENGQVVIDDLDQPGDCEVTCDIEGASNDDTADFVREA